MCALSAIILREKVQNEAHARTFTKTEQMTTK